MKPPMAIRASTPYHGARESAVTAADESSPSRHTALRKLACEAACGREAHLATILRLDSRGDARAAKGNGL